MPRLTKRDVEAMLATYDADPIAALTTALRTLTGRADADWPALAPMATADPDRRTALLAGQVDALDDLVQELNEHRQLDARRLAREADRLLP